MAGKVATIPLSQIRPNPVALRGVDKSSEEYVSLVDSIRKNGVINAISVRELVDPDNPGSVLYGLIDGLHRFTAACDAGLDNINATILALDDAEVEEAQIIANVHKIETKPVEYSKAIGRLMARNPTLTMSELADRLSRSPSWLNERLNLTKLDPKIGSLVDEGKIVLTNAYALSKLPMEEQVNWVDRAITLPQGEFVPQVQARVKELRDALRQGREPKTGFTPTAFMRKLPAIREERTTGAVAKQLGADHASFVLALDWVMNIDRISVAEQEAKYNARKAEEELAKQARKAEREQKKQAEAAATQQAVAA